MAHIGEYAALDGKIVPFADTHISIASSSLLYGLSIYTVFYSRHTDDGLLAFRIDEHLNRLATSARLMGFDIEPSLLDKDTFLKTVTELVAANKATTDQCFRVTIHTNDLLAGVRTNGLNHSMSIFMYEASPILPLDGAKLKTSIWRRVSDTAIPARAKVNGAYVNSALAKQDALNSGYHDCIFLNKDGYVSELSAANIFFIKNKELVTPDPSSDILEGITRRSIMHIAEEMGLKVTERKVALTELYTADEVFASGSSTFIAPVTLIDERKIGTGEPGPLTLELQEKLKTAQNTENKWTTLLT